MYDIAGKKEIIYTDVRSKSSKIGKCQVKTGDGNVADRDMR